MPAIFVCYRASDERFTGVLIDEKVARRLGPDAVFRSALDDREDSDGKR